MLPVSGYPFLLLGLAFILEPLRSLTKLVPWPELMVLSAPPNPETCEVLGVCFKKVDFCEKSVNSLEKFLLVVLFKLGCPTKHLRRLLWLFPAVISTLNEINKNVSYALVLYALSPSFQFKTPILYSLEQLCCRLILKHN